MLIIYRKLNGDVVYNSGTNSYLPLGPSFEDEVQNAIEIYGGAADDYGEFRLHDVEQADLVQKCLTHNYVLEFDNSGNPVGVIIGDILPPPEPELELPSQEERIEALESAMLELVLGGGV